MDDLDRDIHNAFHARQLPAAPANLAISLDALPRRQARPGSGAFRLVLGLAATLAVLVVAAVAVSIGSHSLPPAGSPGPSLPGGHRSVRRAVVRALVGGARLAAPISRQPVPTPTVSADRATAAHPEARSQRGTGRDDRPRDGWAVGDQRLLLTADGGSTLAGRESAGAHPGWNVPANLLNVEFLDPDHGWVAVRRAVQARHRPELRPDRCLADVGRRTDLGEVGAAQGEDQQRQATSLRPFSFDFLDATHGFAFLSGNYTHRLGDSDLYYTADGGKTWSADRPTGPGFQGVEGSSISFATADDGVVVGSPAASSGIFVTHDGGRTWAEATVALLASFGGDLRVYSQPVFSDSRTGLVAVRFQGATQSVTRIYRTTDGGSSWSYVMPIPGSGALMVTIVDSLHWIATDGSDAVHTQNGGASWTQLVTQPPLEGLQAIGFIDLKHGWAAVDGHDRQLARGGDRRRRRNLAQPRPLTSTKRRRAEPSA